jgi:hypothetical protein
MTSLQMKYNRGRQAVITNELYVLALLLQLVLRLMFLTILFFCCFPTVSMYVSLSPHTYFELELELS